MCAGRDASKTMYTSRIPQPRALMQVSRTQKSVATPQTKTRFLPKSASASCAIASSAAGGVGWCASHPHRTTEHALASISTRCVSAAAVFHHLTGWDRRDKSPRCRPTCCTDDPPRWQQRRSARRRSVSKRRFFGARRAFSSARQNRIPWQATTPRS